MESDATQLWRRREENIIVDSDNSHSVGHSFATQIKSVLGVLKIEATNFIEIFIFIKQTMNLSLIHKHIMIISLVSQFNIDRLPASTRITEQIPAVAI